MHTGPIPGNYTDKTVAEPTIPCRACGKMTVTSRAWDSSDGAYTDYHYECGACGHSWWIEGPDA